MCGIVGLIHRDKPIGTTELDCLRITLEKMKYRGPDGWGIWHDEKTALGHRRLSIIDLSELGHQPMVDPESGIVVIFNGEIYNYRILKRDIEARGFVFRSNSDTEVLIHAYRCFGNDFLSHLRGMFAFCLYDPAHQKIILARDRMGKKPLFYFLDREHLYFASELKAFHSIENLDLQIDRESIKSFLLLQFIPGPHTIYKNIQSLSPGSFLDLDLATWHVSKRSYWSLLDFPCLENGESKIRDLDERLAESVELRLISDVEVGLLLSGGIDSSLLSWYVANSGTRMRAFTAGFGKKDLDETDFAEMVAEQLNFELIITPGGALTPEIFKQIVFHMDQPLGDSACVPTFLLSKAFSKYIKVVLSGEGADELFLGYPHYQFEYLWPTIHPFQSLLQMFFSPELASQWEYHASIPSVIVRGAKAISANNDLGAMRWTTVFSEKSVSRITGDETPAQYVEEMNLVYQDLRKRHNHLKAAAIFDLLYWLPDDLLVKVDRMTMAHSVEARAPFLDHELVTSALNIPQNQLMNLKQTKIALRKLVSRKFEAPTREIIMNRPKHGLETNTAEWLKGPLNSLATERLSPSALSASGLLDLKDANRLWLAFQKADSHSPLRRKVWLLIVLQTWFLWHNRKFAE